MLSHPLLGQGEVRACLRTLVERATSLETIQKFCFYLCNSIILTILSFPLFPLVITDYDNGAGG